MKLRILLGMSLSTLPTGTKMKNSQTIHSKWVIFYAFILNYFSIGPDNHHEQGNILLTKGFCSPNFRSDARPLASLARLPHPIIPIRFRPLRRKLLKQNHWNHTTLSREHLGIYVFHMNSIEKQRFTSTYTVSYFRYCNDSNIHTLKV